LKAFQIFENILEENAQHNVWKAKTMPDEGQLEPTSIKVNLNNVNDVRLLSIIEISISPFF
jgi:hypothetical protein